MTVLSDNAQSRAADPRINAFVTANAGSGKTKTLIDRVARLLLARAKPAAILCITYTKAAAAEMQARLFELLGDWAVTDDAELRAILVGLLGEEDAAQQDLAAARGLFASALETPGGLKIQTIHAFCEQLLRRFPLEAGVSPNFTVMDDAAAALVVREARDRLAGDYLERYPTMADAYARMAIRLDQMSFEAMFAAFETRREALAGYVERQGGLDGVAADVWLRCGFGAPTTAAEVEAEALAAVDRDALLAAAQLLSVGGKNDGKSADQIGAWLTDPNASLADLLAIFFTEKGQGTPATWVAKTAGLKSDERLRDRLLALQTQLEDDREALRAVRVAEETLSVLALAFGYAQAYAAAKEERQVLDFADLSAKARDLVAKAPGAPWVLYKLDEGLEHVLIDEAQDTAPEQWEIAKALTDEFFGGQGREPREDRPADRSVFVVGDEKQSIYSFQGADPDRLVIETHGYIERITAARRLAEQTPLITSYRSTPEVLAFVDTLFSIEATRSGVRPPEGTPALVHKAHRENHAGCVDLWPLEVEEKKEERIAWDAPLDSPNEGSASRKLANRIADEIAGLVARGEHVFDKRDKDWRPARYGDVLILVRKRAALFEDVIRALRRRGVPVAGADRLTLSEHIAFDDLMALARFVLFPTDDLNLAALLKSPLCGLADADIYRLAHRRGDETLWSRLGASTDPADAPAQVYLAAALNEAASPPFELFSRLLTLRDAAGASARSRMTARLGSEAGDVIDEFLARVLEAERRGVVALEALAAAFEGLEISVKREMEGAADEVRVMTAHGAKGLEAPIVFLPETTVTQSQRGSPLMVTEDGKGFLWCARTADDCAASRAARERRAAKEEGESWRLLYVALTRARDRLVLCGKRPANLKEDAEPGWYGALAQAFRLPGIANFAHPVTREGGFTFQRFGKDPTCARPGARIEAVNDNRDGTTHRPVPKLGPAFLHDNSPEEAPALAWVSPSAAAVRARGPAPSPLARQGGVDRFRRGDLIHRLLQLLPEIPEPDRRGAAARLLAREPDLTDPQRAEMIDAALGVLSDPEFAEVFGPGSRAEAALAGVVPELAGLAVSGRMDRLLVTPAGVLVIDFKTNRPAPPAIEDADPAYIAQMAVYWAVLRQVFPGRPVRAALVWTDGPRLMPVPENMMSAALYQMASGR